MEKTSGSHNFIEHSNAIKRIELITKRYKNKKIKTEDYIIEIHSCLEKLTTKRNYIEYLTSIGQINN